MRFPWQHGDDPEDVSEFVQLGDLETLEAFMTQSAPEPTLLMIHDPWCPISAGAFRQVAQVGGVVHLVVTGDGRHLSAHIEAVTGVRHKSPQAFVLADGKVRWHASHGRTTRAAVREALAAAAASGEPR